MPSLPVGVLRFVSCHDSALDEFRDEGDEGADRVRRGSDEAVRRQVDAIPQIEVVAEIYWRGHAYLRHDQPHFLRRSDEAYRLFHELVPDTGEGVQFTPPFSVDYGIGLTIGRDTFLNKDFMVCGGGYVTLGAVASVPSLRLDETDCTSHAMQALQVSA